MAIFRSRSAQLCKHIQHALAGVLDVFFPPVCPGCGTRLLYPEQWLCPACRRSLQHTEQVFQRDNTTEALFVNAPHFEKAAAVLFYEEDTPLQHIVHAAKYHHRPDLFYRLAFEAARELVQASFLDDIDFIMPVPLHPRQLRRRGYNQAEWIARGISDYTGLPVVTGLLERQRDTRQQAKQTASSRADNVHGAFVCPRPELLTKKSVLLVDDIVTTGNTLNACMQALSSVRGLRITVFTLAKAR